MKGGVVYRADYDPKTLDDAIMRKLDVAQNAILIWNFIHYLRLGWYLLFFDDPIQFYSNRPKCLDDPTFLDDAQCES
jgi:hypothetical protein